MYKLFRIYGGIDEKVSFLAHFYKCLKKCATCGLGGPSVRLFVHKKKIFTSDTRYNGHRRSIGSSYKWDKI